MQNTYSTLANQYFSIKGYRQSINFDKKILKRWPKREPSFYRLGYALSKLGKHQEALRVYTEGIKKSQGNAIALHVARLELLDKLKDKVGIRKAFVEFLNASQNTRHLIAYKFLAKFVIHDYQLWQYIPQFYKQFTQYHGYNCIFESVTASYYINSKNYSKANQHVDEILQHNDRKCINPKILEILKR
jgi:tetratricopeptide (TPR) repeat protein